MLSEFHGQTPKQVSTEGPQLHVKALEYWIKLGEPSSKHCFGVCPWNSESILHARSQIDFRNRRVAGLNTSEPNVPWPVVLFFPGLHGYDKYNAAALTQWGVFLPAHVPLLGE